MPCLHLAPEEWHLWFTVQAGWTHPTRLWLYRQVRLGRAQAVLEVGCGTGVITEELTRLSGACVVGLDCNPTMLAFAREGSDRAVYVCGDAHTLPFPDKSFDIAVCHYLLLWLADPERGVQEMARVVRQGGWVLACAEPDYGGRIDHPPELAALGHLQAESLRRQGADPEIGRRLGELFATAGLQTMVGTMAGQWRLPAAADVGFDAEWRIREHDLAGLVAPEELQRLRALDHQALVESKRILYVPTFYALGEKT